MAVGGGGDDDDEKCGDGTKEVATRACEDKGGDV